MGQCVNSKMAETIIMKSYDRDNDPIFEYIESHSLSMHPAQKELMKETLTVLESSDSKMLGAPEVLQMNQVLMKTIKAKKAIDVGVFTGASSLAAALALPDDGKVVGCDVSEDFTSHAKKYWTEAGVEKKIKLEIAPAADTLNKLVDNGEENTFDFAFIDADKGGYDTYFELCLKLMRKGGIIAFDDTLRDGKVLNENDTGVDLVAIRKLNEKLGKDTRVNTSLLNIGDGYTLVTKL